MEQDVSPKNQTGSKQVVLITNGNYDFAQSIVSIITETSTCDLVRRAEPGSDALQMIDSNNPDLVVVAVWQNNPKSLSLIREIRRIQPLSRVLIVSKHSDALYISNAFQAGIIGYVVEGSGPEKIMQGCAAALRNEFFMDDISSNDVQAALS